MAIGGLGMQAKLLGVIVLVAASGTLYTLRLLPSADRKMPGLARHAPRIVVVGSGLAGTAAALAAAEAGGPLAEVMVLEKEPRPGGNSMKASSGINALEPAEGDSMADFRGDTLKSGGGLSVPELVDALVVSCRRCGAALLRRQHNTVCGISELVQPQPAAWRQAQRTSCRNQSRRSSPCPPCASGWQPGGGGLAGEAGHRPERARAAGWAHGWVGGVGVHGRLELGGSWAGGSERKEGQSIKRAADPFLLLPPLARPSCRDLHAATRWVRLMALTQTCLARCPASPSPNPGGHTRKRTHTSTKGPVGFSIMKALLDLEAKEERIRVITGAKVRWEGVVGGTARRPRGRDCVASLHPSARALLLAPQPCQLATTPTHLALCSAGRGVAARAGRRPRDGRRLPRRQRQPAHAAGQRCGAGDGRLWREHGAAAVVRAPDSGAAHNQRALGAGGARRGGWE